MIKILLFSCVCLLLSMIVKQISRPFALFISFAGVIMILFGVSGEISSLFESVKSLFDKTDVSGAYISLMIKILGISLIVQFVADLCRDNGETALAFQTETAAKILIIIMVFPLFETVIEIVMGFVK